MRDESWRALGDFLSRDLLIFTPEERAALLGVWKEIAAAERDLDDRLVVGLVGGTGVGKSTLINALAGAEISKSGDRRPTTDRVIVYRHARTEPPPQLPKFDRAEPEVLHETPDLERVILLDFPDFDSVEELHHEVLAAYCPHLDVLIVLVDDVKYADARLFDLLRRVPQSHENLHGVLNKVDRLERRYPGRWRVVAAEILDDFASKLSLHAGVRIRRQGLLAISAANAFLARAGRGPRGGSLENPSGPGASEADGREVGDFPALIEFLASYRLEKRRRAAKELNLDARKDALAARLRGALEPGRAARAARAAELVDRRAAELARTLAGIRAALFTPDERRRIVSTSLERSAPRFGFPIDFLLTLARQVMPWRRPRVEGIVELSLARVREHYRPYIDAVENLRAEAALDAGDLIRTIARAARPDDKAPGRTASFDGAGEELERRLAAREAALSRRSRAWNHLLPLLIVAVYAWGVIYEPLRTALRRLAGQERSSWAGVARDLFLSALESLHPASLVGLALAVAAAYAASALAAWVRQVQRLEAAVSEAEDDFRSRVRDFGEGEVREIAGAITRWRGEWGELGVILGSDATTTPAALRV